MNTLNAFLNKYLAAKLVQALILLTLVGGALPSAAHAEASPAQQTIQGFLNAIKAMDFNRREAPAYKAAANAANSSLDMKAMAKTALSAHWDAVQEDQQIEFVTLLSELVELIAYPRSQEFLGDLELRFSEDMPVKGGVKVTSTVVRDNAALNAPVDYYLRPEADHWIIYDIFLDDISITEDLQYQWDQVIKTSAFSGLLEKMRERLQKARLDITTGAKN